MAKSGRVINGWKGDSGAVPPKTQSIKTSKSKVRTFIDCLMKHTQVKDQDMQDLMVANFLRFYSDFIQIMKHKPKRGKVDFEFLQIDENETEEDRDRRERETEKQIVNGLIKRNIFLNKVSSFTETFAFNKYSLLD